MIAQTRKMSTRLHVDARSESVPGETKMSRGLSEKQRSAIAFANDDADMCLSIGSIRSGKTYASTIAFFFHTQRLPRPYKHLILGRKVGTIKAEILPLMRGLAQAFNLTYVLNRANGELLIGSQIYMLAAGNDERSQDRIMGLTIHSVLVDEATLVPESFFKAAITRMTYADSKLWATTNPSFTSHWLKREWVDEGKFGEVIPFLMDDNPSLTEQVKDRNKALFSGAFAQRMIHGLWSDFAGLVYPQHTVDMLDTSQWRVRSAAIGVDYGPASATAGIAFKYLQDRTDRSKWKLYICDELYIEGGSDQINKTDAELCDAFETFSDKTRCHRLVVDPSAKSFKREARKRDFQVINANNNVLFGLRTAGSLLAQQDVIIDPRCENLLREIGGYLWDEKREDTPIKRNDHACDAMRYGIMYYASKLGTADPITLPEGL